MPILPKQQISPEPVRPVRNARPQVAKPQRSFLPVIIIIVLAITTLLSAGSAAYFYLRYQDLSKNPDKIAADENKALVDRVGKLMILPPDETPTIATVTDLAPFKGQPFFANAKVGDKVIIYTNAKRAILYDPVGDKIVEVAPLNTDTNSSPTNVPAANQNQNTPPKK
jgi:hypothetical protein